MNSVNLRCLVDPGYRRWSALKDLNSGKKTCQLGENPGKEPQFVLEKKVRDSMPENGVQAGVEKYLPNIPGSRISFKYRPDIPRHSLNLPMDYH